MKLAFADDVDIKKNSTISAEEDFNKLESFVKHVRLQINEHKPKENDNNKSRW